jgi:hypothetical protein
MLPSAKGTRAYERKMSPIEALRVVPTSLFSSLSSRPLKDELGVFRALRDEEGE